MKSKLLITTAVSSAFIAASCGSSAPDRNASWTTEEDTKVCTDDKGNRVDDEKCKQTRVHNSGSGAAVGFFAWYYLSRGGRVPAIGNRVSGGAFQPTTGRSYRSSSVARGGFGARSSSSSSSRSGISS